MRILLPLLTFHFLFINCPLTYAWEKELGFGFLQTNGNSSSKSNNLKLHLQNNDENLFYDINISFFSQSKQGNNTAERYKISAQTDKRISDQKYLYLLFLTEDDRFSGFDYQSSINFGYSRVLVKDIKNTLQLEFGPGYRVSSIPSQPKEKEITFRVNEEYQLNLSDDAVLQQGFSIASGEENTIMNLELNLTSNITNSLSLSLIFDTRYIKYIPVGKKNYDSKTSIQFNYEF